MLYAVQCVSSRYHSFSTTAAARDAAAADTAAPAAADGAADAAQHTQAAVSSTAAAASGVLQTSCKVAGRIWTFETGRLAGLAHGSCVVTVEGTSVLGTAVVDPTPQLEADGVPLQVGMALVTSLWVSVLSDSSQCHTLCQQQRAVSNREKGSSLRSLHHKESVGHVPTASSSKHQREEEQCPSRCCCSLGSCCCSLGS